MQHKIYIDVYIAHALRETEHYSYIELRSETALDVRMKLQQGTSHLIQIVDRS